MGTAVVVMLVYLAVLLWTVRKDSIGAVHRSFLIIEFGKNLVLAAIIVHVDSTLGRILLTSIQLLFVIYIAVLRPWRHKDSAIMIFVEAIIATIRILDLVAAKSAPDRPALILYLSAVSSIVLSLICWVLLAGIRTVKERKANLLEKKRQDSIANVIESAKGAVIVKPTPIGVNLLEYYKKKEQLIAEKSADHSKIAPGPSEENLLQHMEQNKRDSQLQPADNTRELDQSKRDKWEPLPQLGKKKVRPFFTILKQEAEDLLANSSEPNKPAIEQPINVVNPAKSGIKINLEALKSSARRRQERLKKEETTNDIEFSQSRQVPQTKNSDNNGWQIRIKKKHHESSNSESNQRLSQVEHDQLLHADQLKEDSFGFQEIQDSVEAESDHKKKPQHSREDTDKLMI